jgi:hypothetical protein
MWMVYIHKDIHSLPNHMAIFRELIYKGQTHLKVGHYIIYVYVYIYIYIYIKTNFNIHMCICGYCCYIYLINARVVNHIT